MHGRFGLELLESRVLLSTYTLTGPGSGEVARASTAFTVALDSATISGTVRITPQASNGDGVFSPAYVDLTNTTRSGTFVYTPAEWSARTIFTINNGGLTDPLSVSYLSMVQTGGSGTAPSGDLSPDFGDFSVFTNGGWWPELGRNVRGDAVAPNSAAIISQIGGNLYNEFGAPSSVSGWAWETGGGQPFNVVPGNTPLKTITADYYDESDVDPVTHTAQVPIPANPVIEGWYSATGAFPSSNNYGLYGDSHMLIYVRNETTGGVDTLWEAFQAWTPDGGATWHCSGLSKYDLTTGAQRFESFTSADAAGLPLAPLEFKYPEVAAAMARNDHMGIGHPIRTTIKASSVLNKAETWPAKHAVSGSGLLPMGARLRITSAWYNANAANFTGQARVFVDTLYQSGAIIADIGGINFAVEGVCDDRWDNAATMSLRTIPMTAFEALVQPLAFTVTGPTSGSVGTSYIFTLQQQPAAEENFSQYLKGAYNGVLENSDNRLLFLDGHVMDDAHRTLRVQYTPSAAGTPTIEFRAPGTYWMTPPVFTFTAVTGATSPPVPAPLSATAISQTQINLSWVDHSNNETGFYIDQASDAGFGAGLTTSTVGANVTTFSAIGLSSATPYYFRVRAYNASGSSANTSTASAITQHSPPTVTAVYVRGSSWASSYLSFMAGNLPGSSATYGYAIPVGSGSSQLQTLPWRNINQISIAFSEDVSIAQAQFAIVGSVGSYSVSGFSYSSIDHVATWSLSAVIGADKLYVAVPGSGSSPVKDAAGTVLDGEWSNPGSYGDAGPTSVFPSGNGTAGGDFAFRLDVLPGDSTGGSLGKVNVADIAQTKSRSGPPVSISSYRSDFDGNNLVNVADIAYVKSRSGTNSLPVNPPVLPVFGLAFSQVSLLLKERSLTLW